MKTLIEMAREAGLFTHKEVQAELKAFEALVRADERNRTWTQEHWTEYERSIAAAEREACAKKAETLGVHPALNVFAGGPDWYKHGKEIAAAIRNRGNA
jgi:hypothetical protein